MTFVKCDWLDGKHVLFGEVKEGLEHLDKLEAIGGNDGKPKKKATIVKSG